jgi:putative membrane protein
VAGDVKIPNWAQKFISAEDCIRIGHAVDEAEKKTKGEIVPMIVLSSASAHMVPWTASLFLLIILFLADDVFPAFFNMTWAAWVLPAIFIVGFFFFRTHWARVRLHRILLHPVDRHAQVLARAEVEFHRSRFDKTSEHSSILIMASLLERDVVVYADSGVIARVQQGTWSEVVRVLIKGIKDNRVADGWIQAIAAAGTILSKNFPAENHANNQIANEIIIKE